MDRIPGPFPGCRRAVALRSQASFDDYHATTMPDTYLENILVDARGKVDFFDAWYTKNGRTT